VPSELQAAYLYAQLRKIERIKTLRRRLYERYREALLPLELQGHLRLPFIPAGVKSNYHLFHILLDSPKTRDRLIGELRRRGVTSVFHYFPLHLSRMGRRFGYRAGQLPVSEWASARLLRLPLYNQMSVREQEYVIRSIQSVLQ